MNCECPDDGILIEIPVEDCPFDMKQVQKLAFATQGNVVWDSATGGGAGDGVPQANSQLDTLADWQARRTAIDNTKMVITPFVGGDPIIEAGEAVTNGGGDNATLNGVEEVLDTNPSKYSCVFKSITPETEKALKALMCKRLEVYFILEGGRIACYKIDGGVRHRGFILESMFVGDRNNAGFGSKDTNALMFSLPAGWSENLAIVTPTTFNPLYDI